MATPIPMHEETTRTARPHIEVQDIRKQFGGITALAGMNLRVRSGTIHGLVGENGAGKSTLGAILVGATRPDSGRLMVHGKHMDFKGPRDGIAAKITRISQELVLEPHRTVMDNIFLGMEDSKMGILQSGTRQAKFARLLEMVDFQLSPKAVANTLSVAEQQQVEILRALARDAELIIMDEPTTSLTRVECDHLFTVISKLRDAGTTILFISHALDDVGSLCDDVSILRDGRLVRSDAASTMTTSDMIEGMIGRPLDVIFPPKSPPRPEASVALRVSGLTNHLLRDVSFSVKEGEILGISGLVGSGRSEVLRAIFGADRSGDSRIHLQGRAVKIRSPRQAKRAGIGLIPESRKVDGLNLGRTILENSSLAYLDKYSRAKVIQRRYERRSVAASLAELGVPAGRLDLRVGSLSGGNQQKVLFSKWLNGSPRVLLVDEPTRGVDVGAKVDFYRLLASLAASGVAVVIVSSENEELIGLAHRVIVLSSGRLVAEFDEADMTVPKLLDAAFSESQRRKGDTDES